MLKVYTTSTCQPCKMVKQFLDSKGAEYETIILDEQPDKVDEVMAISGEMSVPVVTDGRYVVVGWSPNKLTALL
jgi:glutaredoxin